MTILEYRGSQSVASEISGLTLGNEFYTLIMAAFRYADSDNLAKLQDAFPDVYAEFIQRYHAPGGALNKAEMDYVTQRHE